MIGLKKSLIATSVVLVLGATSASYAAYGLPETPAPISSNNWYIGAFGGVAFPPSTVKEGVKTKYSTGWDAGAEIGFRSGALRYELEYIYQRANVKSQSGTTTPNNTGNVKVNSGMANVLYDFGDPGATYSPYIGGGIGYANVKQTDRSSDNKFAYQAMIGVAFNVLDNASLTLGYRYFGTSKANAALGERFQNHMLNAGLVYYVE